MLSDHYFGDVEAIDEGRNHPGYFHATFILPSSFSLTSLNNKNKYIIVGRKGSGKTAVQFHLSRELERKGYLSHFFSFYNDLRPVDYNDAAATQKIDVISISNPRNIFLNYDFRDLWERTFLIKIAEESRANDIENKFVKFTLGDKPRLSGIFEGLLKSASVSISADMGALSAEVNLDLKEFVGKDAPISSFIKVSRELLRRYMREFKFYLFVDELVFSKLDSKDDEVRVRAAMVRDILRTARSLNNFFAEHDLDFHIVCSLRPEIRNFINDLDAEIGKVFDGKSVDLTWDSVNGDDSTIMNILKQKVIHSRYPKAIDFEGFVAKSISFGGKKLDLNKFLNSNTWSRPRDIIQLLNAIALRSPNSDCMGEFEIKAALNEYSRRTMNEIIEEVSVRHGSLIAVTLRERITQREFVSFDDFLGQVLGHFKNVSREDLLKDLFYFGVIGNVDYKFEKKRFYWFHRGEEFFKKDMGVAVHPGLWNYFNIR